MGDLLPPEAAARRALCARVMQSFERAGYELVTPPVFEHSEVVERGNGAVDNRDLLRFVEPESGEVAVLRPDITPQIARIVATQLWSKPTPIRLCYEGRVFRRQRGRARSHQQISQAGIECIGLGEVDGDAEVLALALRACESAGLREYRAELSDVRVVHSLLDQVPAGAREALSELMAHKDRTALLAVAKGHGVDTALAKKLALLADCYGDASVLATARRKLGTPAVKLALDNLERIAERVGALGLGTRLSFDLGETRGLSYYTGMHFTLLAPGPGEALGGGGRYDSLLARFGFDAPASGFALDLGHLQWTLSASGHEEPRDTALRIAVAGDDRARLDRATDQLRRQGHTVAALPAASDEACLAFVRAWRYDGVLRLTARGSAFLRPDGTSQSTPGKLQDLGPWLSAKLNGRARTNKRTRD